jgi:NTE family protein
MPTRKPQPKTAAAAAAAAPKTRRAGPAAAPRPQTIDLALQGGGSHGAFTWGVLDRLLEERWLQFDGVSGTSAGALNAAVMATGMARGGREAARAALRAFWEGVAGGGSCFGSLPAGMAMPTMPLMPQWPWLQGSGAGTPPLNPLLLWWGEFSRLFSPYQFNPFDLNPLRDLVRRHVDIGALRHGPLSVFVNATAVQNGRPRIFRREDLSHDALLASACLPQLFKAVVIDGQPYWDGGYSGNPALWPLIYETAALDLLLVKVDPLVRPGTPDTPHEIQDRLNEITFNAGLVSEMRAIAFVQKLHREGRVDAGAYKNLRLHMVGDEAAMVALSPSSKLDTGRALLLGLHAKGRAAAEQWLAGDGKLLGQRSTLDVRRVFLGEGATN